MATFEIYASILSSELDTFNFKWWRWGVVNPRAELTLKKPLQA